jgi:hypothetical protein
MKRLFALLFSLSLICACSEAENISESLLENTLGDSLSDCDIYDAEESRYIVHEADSLFRSIFQIETIAVVFRQSEIQTFSTLYPNSNVRFYAAISSNSSSDTIVHLPKLVMVATDSMNCETDLDSLVVFSYQPSRGHYQDNIVPMSDSIQQLLYNWQNLYDTDTIMQEFIPFYGNNHTWAAIDSAANGKDLAIQFAINKDSLTDSLTIDLYMTEFGSGAPGQPKEFFDFSKPCPRLCGQLARRQKLITFKED